MRILGPVGAGTRPWGDGFRKAVRSSVLRRGGDACLAAGVARLISRPGRRDIEPGHIGMQESPESGRQRRAKSPPAKSRNSPRSETDGASSWGACLFVPVVGREALAFAALCLLRGRVALARVALSATTALALDPFDFRFGAPHVVLIGTGLRAFGETGWTLPILCCFEGGPAFDRGAFGARCRAFGGIGACSRFPSASNRPSRRPVRCGPSGILGGSGFSNITELRNFSGSRTDLRNRPSSSSTMPQVVSAALGALVGLALRFR